MGRRGNLLVQPQYINAPKSMVYPLMCLVPFTERRNSRNILPGDCHGPMALAMTRFMELVA